MEDATGQTTGQGAQPTGAEGGAGPAPLLRRSKTDRVLFGVCGGLGRYFGVEPVMVRLLFVLLAVFGGGGVLLYLVALVVVPEERPGEPVTADRERAPRTVVLAIGGGLVLLGSVLLAQRLVPWLSDLFGPALLIVVGVAVIAVARR